MNVTPSSLPVFDDEAEPPTLRRAPAPQGPPRPPPPRLAERKQGDDRHVDSGPFGQLLLAPPEASTSDAPAPMTPSIGEMIDEVLRERARLAPPQLAPVVDAPASSRAAPAEPASHDRASRRDRSPRRRRAPWAAIGQATFVASVAALVGFTIARGGAPRRASPPGGTATPTAATEATPSSTSHADASTSSAVVTPRAAASLAAAPSASVGVTRVTYLPTRFIVGEAPPGASASPGDVERAADAPPAQPAASSAALGAQHLPDAVPAEGAPPAPDAGLAAFDGAAALLALATREGQARGCWSDGDPRGMARVSVTFAPSGKATLTRVDGDFAGHRVGGCIAARLRNLTVAPFAGQPVTVVHRLYFP